MCWSKLIKAFDFPATVCVCACVLEAQGSRLLPCLISFFNLVILITVHIYLHSLFCFLPSIGIFERSCLGCSH